LRSVGEDLMDEFFVLVVDSFSEFFLHFCNVLILILDGNCFSRFFFFFCFVKMQAKVVELFGALLSLIKHSKQMLVNKYI